MIASYHLTTLLTLDLDFVIMSFGFRIHTWYILNALMLVTWRRTLWPFCYRLLPVTDVSMVQTKFSSVPQFYVFILWSNYFDCCASIDRVTVTFYMLLFMAVALRQEPVKNCLWWSFWLHFVLGVFAWLTSVLRYLSTLILEEACGLPEAV